MDDYASYTNYKTLITKFETAYDDYLTALDKYDIYKSMTTGEDAAAREITRSQAEMSYQDAQKAVSDHKVYAPVSGVIAAKIVSDYNVISAQTSSYVISQEGLPTVSFNLSEGGALAMTLGAPVVVTYNGKEYNAEVVELSPEADSSTGLYPAKAQFTENIGDLTRSGAVVKVMAITAQEKNTSITDYIEDNIVPEIKKIEGVGEVSVRGGRNKYISIELLEDRLTQYGLTMSDVSKAISTAEFEITMGAANRGDIELSMVGSAEYDTYQALANIPISLKSGDILHISDVANVYMVEQERASYSRRNGYENISISVTKEQSANTIQLCNQISALVDKFNANDNLGLNIKISSNSSETIMNNTNSVVSSLILGLVISVLVLIFFGEWRASLIVGLSMPISVMAALVIMSAFDMTINMMSLGGLVVGIGMMVDNSIVVIESCFRARTEDRTFKESVTTGANLVAGSVIASTATTVVVFLPISLMDGMAGQLFKDTGFTIVFSITASLISALTLVPLLFVKMKPREKMESVSNRMLKFIDKYYTRLIRKAINARKTVVLIAVHALLSQD